MHRLQALLDFELFRLSGTPITPITLLLLVLVAVAAATLGPVVQRLLAGRRRRSGGAPIGAG